MTDVDLDRHQVILGSDEAGKGEWLGPLTIAAVAVTPKHSAYLVTQGVMDSKELRLEMISTLAEVIKGNCLSYSVITITPRRFNELMQEVKREGRSLNDILAWGHAKAINQVYEELKGKGLHASNIRLIIDEFDRLKTENRLRRVIDLDKFDFLQKPKAEEEIAVAAASIMARATRELWIDEAVKRLNIDLRNLSATEARTHEDAKYFAKISFLRRK